jgi:hypothetical protein
MKAKVAVAIAQLARSDSRSMGENNLSETQSQMRNYIKNIDNDEHTNLYFNVLFSM